MMNTPSKKVIGRVRRRIVRIKEKAQRQQELIHADAEKALKPLKVIAREVREYVRHNNENVVNVSMRFKYEMSKYCKWTTAIVWVLIAIAGLVLFVVSSGSYLSASFISVAVAVCLLYLISFPRYLKLTDDKLEINCILEQTTIPLVDIKRICRIERYRLRNIFPLLGSYGFGGFFGYYFDLAHLRFVRVFATKLDSLIIIQDIYNERYIINCDDADLLINSVRERITKLKDTALEAGDADADDDD